MSTSDSKTRDDGGPAFPSNEKESDGSHYHSHGGMTLRDYFAAKVTAAMIVESFANSHAEGFSPQESARILSEASYKVADAMIAAREARDA